MMEIAETRAAWSLSDVINVATRVLTQLNKLISCWSSAPKEVFQLRDAVTGFCRLLDQAAQHASQFPSNDSSTRWLFQELGLAQTTLLQLERLLDAVQGLKTVDGSKAALPPAALLKARWWQQREKAFSLLAELKGVYQRVLTSLALLNLSISTDIFDSSLRNNSVPSVVEPTLHQSVQEARELAGDVKFRAEDMESLGIVQPKEHNRLNQREIVLECSTPMLKGFPSSTGTQLNQKQTKDTLMVEHQPMPRDDQGQIEIRTVQNEQKFRSIEHVFWAITSPLNSQGTTSTVSSKTARQFQDASSTITRSRRACTPLCRCKCHIRGSSSKWGLSALRSTLGSFTFVFTGALTGKACTLPSCKNRQAGKWFRASYTFPSWLFHAAVSFIYTDHGAGAPELILRVVRRIPPNTNVYFTSIFAFVRRGEIDNLKRALRRGTGSMLDVDEDGISLLSSAFRKRRFDIAELLLREGADLFQEDDHGRAAVDDAIGFLYTDANMSISTRRMLEQALSLEMIIEYSELTDLHMIVMGIKPLDVREYLHSRSPDELEKVINAGDYNGRTPLFYAAARGNASAVQALLDFGALTDPPSPPADPKTALHVACQNNRLEAVRKLLAAGADVDARFSTASSAPIHQACRLPRLSPDASELDRQKQAHDLVEIVALLLSYGTDINAVDAWRSTGLDFACLYNQEPLVNFFIHAGADVNHRDWEGTSALGSAVLMNGCESAVVLLAHGADYRNVDDNGQGILHYLGMSGNVEMMELFAGLPRVSAMDVTARDSQGRTPWELCTRRADATDELKEMFARVLAAVAGTQESEGADDEGSGFGSEPGEFFDALEESL